MSQATAPFNDASHPLTDAPQNLWAAIERGDLDAVKNFVALFPEAVKLTVPILSIYTAGDRAIHIAARAHKTEIIDFLLSKGAGLEDRNAETGETPLLASLGSTISIPLHFIGLGADKAVRDNLGRNALHIAALSGFTVTAAKLLDAKMDIEEPDQQGNTPLLLAVQAKNAGTARNFLGRGARVTTPGMDGVLALDMAAANAAKLDFDGAWAKLLPIITEKSAAEMMIRSIKSSDEAAQRLSRGTGSDVNAPVKASFRPKLPKHF